MIIIIIVAIVRPDSLLLALAHLVRLETEGPGYTDGSMDGGIKY